MPEGFQGQVVTPEMEDLYKAIDNLRDAMMAVVVSGMPLQDVLALVQARMAYAPDQHGAAS